MNASVTSTAGAVRNDPSARALLAGRIVTGFVTIFLVADGTLRVAGFAPYLEGTTRYGYPISMAAGIGITLLVATVLYALPRTAVVGGLLITAYLGGAVASHVRVGDSLVFPVVMGVLTWLGLYLREPRLRDLLPLRANL